jgi:hypothetical protein
MLEREIEDGCIDGGKASRRIYLNTTKLGSTALYELNIFRQKLGTWKPGYGNTPIE